MNSHRLMSTPLGDHHTLSQAQVKTLAEPNPRSKSEELLHPIVTALVVSRAAKRASR